MLNHFTFHFRLTDGCNASCTYCSADSHLSGQRMSVSDFKASCDFLRNEFLPKMSKAKTKHLSIQYVGGEVLTIPFSELEECVTYARRVFSDFFLSVTDGVQSNLLSSPEKVEKLNELFGGNLGSSVDSYSNLRTFKGKSDGYRRIFDNSVKKGLSGIHPPSVFVLDKTGISNLYQQYTHAIENNYNLTVNPVFLGGNDVDKPTNDEAFDAYKEVFEDWFLRRDIIVQPLYQLLSKRVARKRLNIDSLRNNSGCPFQTNCANVSLNVEPDGNLYVCYDMADSDQYPLGNSIAKQFDWNTYDLLSSRTQKINSDCKACDYFVECQGGCMSKAITATGSVFGKTELCSVWFRLFRLFDEYIEENDIEEVHKWLRKIDNLDI